MELDVDTVTTDINYRVALGSSPLAATFVLFMGAATLVMVSAVSFDARIKVFVVLWVGVCMLDAYRTVGLRMGGRGVRGIAIHGEEIEVVDSSGAWPRGVLRDGCFVSAGLTVIRWRPPRARFDRTIVILPDMLPRDAFRRLRVVLRWR
jgi:hypothetical protein